MNTYEGSLNYIIARLKDLCAVYKGTRVLCQIKYMYVNFMVSSVMYIKINLVIPVFYNTNICDLGQ